MPKSSFTWLHVRVFKRYVSMLSRLHDYPERGGLTKCRQTIGETWHGLWISDKTELISPLVFLPAVLHSRSAFCVCERETILEGAERDQCCNVGPRARQGLLHKAEPHHNSLSLSLCLSLCLSILFFLLVSYQKTINHTSHIECSH